MDKVKQYIFQYRDIIGFVLGVLATLAAMTPTILDDQVVKDLQDLTNTIVQEVSPTVVVGTPEVVVEEISPTTVE